MACQRIGRLAIVVIVFVAVGPLLGLVVFALGSGFVTVGNVRAPDASGLSDFAAVVAAMLLYGVAMAHWAGALSAAATGFLVACYAAWRGCVPLVVGGMAGLVGSIVGFADLLGTAVPVAGLTIAVHVLPAIACTRLTRRWQ